MVSGLLQTTFLFAAIANIALAHTVFTEFYVDGISNGPGTCIRMNANASRASFPVGDVDSPDMACGFSGNKGVARVCSVKAGSTMTFEFHSWPADKSKPVLDPSHKGPCAVYMKKVPSAINDTGLTGRSVGVGDGWFKIWAMGYHDQQWCTTHLIDNKGFLSVRIPPGLSSGYYLVRPELLALHNAVNNDPQFYIGCAQIFLTSDGNLSPAETVSIPGYIDKKDRAVTWNLYHGIDPNKYHLPGPTIAKLISSSMSTTNQSKMVQREGLKPDGCILENANFCAFEVSSYTDEKGCWAAGAQCWKQHQECWDTAPATGGAGCKVLGQRCRELNLACKQKEFSGPRKKGQILNHVSSTLTFKPIPWPTDTAVNDISAKSADHPGVPFKVEARDGGEEEEDVMDESDADDDDENACEDENAFVTTVTPSSTPPTTSVPTPISSISSSETWLLTSMQTVMQSSTPTSNSTDELVLVTQVVIETQVAYVTVWA